MSIWSYSRNVCRQDSFKQTLVWFLYGSFVIAQYLLRILFLIKFVVCRLGMEELKTVTNRTPQGILITVIHLGQIFLNEREKFIV